MTAALLSYFGSFIVISIVLRLVYKAEGCFGKMTKLSIIFLFVWHFGSFLLAKSGFLSDFSTQPPKMLLFLPLMLILAVLFTCSKHGKMIIDKTSLWGLIGIQSFRFIPEFMLDMSYREGIAPIQMTYYGANFDILVATLALLVYLGAKFLKGREMLVGVTFSIVGLGLLFNILVIAVLSMPIPIRYFMNEPANTFVTIAPYHFLPFSMVFLALWGHMLIIRKLFSLKLERGA